MQVLNVLGRHKFFHILEDFLKYCSTAKVSTLNVLFNRLVNSNLKDITYNGNIYMPIFNHALNYHLTCMNLWVSTVRKGGGGACDVFEAEDSINIFWWTLYTYCVDLEPEIINWNKLVKPYSIFCSTLDFWSLSC